MGHSKRKTQKRNKKTRVPKLESAIRWTEPSHRSLDTRLTRFLKAANDGMKIGAVKRVNARKGGATVSRVDM